MLKFLTFCSLIVTSHFQNLPSQFTPCDRKNQNFKECTILAAQNALRGLKSSIPELGLESIEPLHLKNFTIDDHHHKVLGVEEKVEDFTLYGFTDTTVTDFDINFDKKKITLNLTGAIQVRVSFRYDGQILGEPIHFKGNGSGSYYENDFSFESSFKEITKENQQFIQIETTKAVWHLKNGSYVTSGDDKVEVEHFNKLAREHFYEIFVEVEEDFENLLAVIFTQIASKVFSKFSKAVLFGFV